MFICTPCCQASGLHERIYQSEGPCEVCNTYTLCNDWPSSQVPFGIKLVDSTEQPVSDYEAVVAERDRLLKRDAAAQHLIGLLRWFLPDGAEAKGVDWRPYQEWKALEPVSEIEPDAPVSRCCEESAPPLSNTRHDGDTFQCLTCGRWWAWDTDEASGSAWWPFDQPTESMRP